MSGVAAWAHRDAAGLRDGLRCVPRAVGLDESDLDKSAAPAPVHWALSGSQAAEAQPELRGAAFPAWRPDPDAEERLDERQAGRREDAGFHQVCPARWEEVPPRPAADGEPTARAATGQLRWEFPDEQARLEQMEKAGADPRESDRVLARARTVRAAAWLPAAPAGQE